MGTEADARKSGSPKKGTSPRGSLKNRENRKLFRLSPISVADFARFSADFPFRLSPISEEP